MKIRFYSIAISTILVLWFSAFANAQEPVSWSEAAVDAGVYSPVVHGSDLDVIGGGRPIAKAIFDKNWSRMIMVYSGFESSNNNGGDVFDGQADLDMDVFGIDIGRRHSDYLRSSIDFTYRTGDIRNGAGLASGEMDIYSLMKNVHLDFPTRARGFQPYLGVGFGYSYTDTAGTINGGSAFVEGDSSIAYQALAGLNYKFRNLASVYVEYRYFSTGELDLSNAGALLNQGNYSAHDVLFGLQLGY